MAEGTYEADGDCTVVDQVCFDQISTTRRLFKRYPHIFAQTYPRELAQDSETGNLGEIFPDIPAQLYMGTIAPPSTGTRNVRHAMEKDESH